MKTENNIPGAGKEANAQFKSKIGLIAATVGSAVGLGTIWRFPAETQANGGGAFLLLFLACMFFLGVPVMLAETSLGRAGRGDAVTTFKRLSPKTYWWITGALALITSYVIISFYMVVAGWTLEYSIQSVTGDLYRGVDPADPSMGSLFHERMQEYICTDWRPLLNTWLMILLNIVVLVKGVQKGIERMSNLLMPVLFLLLIFFCCVSLSLPGASDGLAYFFKPDFSKITWSVVGNALGQAFFSLSLGTGILITYASYYPSDANLVKTSVIVTGLDILVAMLMGVLVFPAVVSFGLQGEGMSGTTLVFVTLPEVFAQMSGTCWWSTLFFMLLMVAALTSTVSMAEVTISFMQNHFKMKRVAATMVVMLPLFVFCALNSLSFGSMANVRILGLTIFNFLDTYATNLLLPLVSLLACLYLGWFAPKGVMHIQITNNGKVAGWIYPAVAFIIKYIAPVLIAVVLVNSLL